MMMMSQIPLLHSTNVTYIFTLPHTPYTVIDPGQESMHETPYTVIDPGQGSMHETPSTRLVSAPDPSQPQCGSLPVSRAESNPCWGWFEQRAIHAGVGLSREQSVLGLV